MLDYLEPPSTTSYDVARFPVRRALTSGTKGRKGEELALSLPRSLTLAEECHLLPMERTSCIDGLILGARYRYPVAER
jgi:hypothetical protein